MQPGEAAVLDVRASADFRPHDRRAKLPDSRPATVAASRFSPDEAILPAPLCDQPLKVEDGPTFARRALGGELVLVLVQGAERVEADHPASLPRRRTLHYGNFGRDESGARQAISP